MNRFIRFVVENHHFSILLVLIIFFYGLVSVYETQLTQDPAIDTPKVHLQFFLDGSSPSEIQRNVIFPVETELRTLADLNDIRTVIYHNYVETWLTFRYGVDIESKSREVESAINKIKRRLPSNLDFTAKVFKISDFISSFVFSLSSDIATPREQYETALDLVSDLEKLDDVKAISVVHADEDISVELDIVAMRRLGISVEQVRDAMRSDNAFAAGGRLHINDRYFRFSGSESSYKNLQSMLQTRVYSASGQPIELSEFAKISKTARSDEGITRHNGKPVFFVKVGANENINILDVKQRVKATVQTFQSNLSKDIKLEWIFDQSLGVETLVFDLLDNFAQGVGILFLVLLFSVGFRSGIIISSILPLSFLTAMFLMGFTGYGIQQMSIAGFIIALGLLVDNGIVVTENAYILQKYKGFNKTDAAIRGSADAFSPLLSSTLTTVLAFMPIFMLTSDIGLFLRSMSVTIWLSLIASLFIAVTIITLLLSRIGTLGGLWFIPNPPSFLILLIPFRDTVYKTLVRWAVKLRIITIILFIGLLVGSLYLATKLTVEVFPPNGEPFFTVNITLPKGMDKDSRQQVIEELETILADYDEIAAVSTFSNVALPRTNVVMDFRGDVVALVRTQSGNADYMRALVAKLKHAVEPLKVYGSITFALFQYKDLTYTSPFTLQLSGNNTDDLKIYAKQIHDQLRDTKGVDTLYNPMKGSQTLLRLEFQAERAAMLGVAKSDVDTLVNMMTYGYEIDRFRDARGKEFPILLKFPPDEAAPLEILQNIHVASHKGGNVPLAEVVKPVFLESESHIAHIQFEPTVEIDVWNKGEYTAEQVAENIMQTIAQTDKPKGIKAHIGGALEKKQQDFQGLGKNALFTASLIFAIFVLQFRSFSQPFIIFSAVPLCIIGALTGLVVMEQSMTFVAAVGITSLMGIVVNDSILLVEEGNVLLKENPSMTVKEASIEAARKRFMPVLLTSVTTIAGLLPMALGDSLFKTMAIAICGGLVSSTFLILFLVPALFSYLSPTRNKAPA